MPEGLKYQMDSLYSVGRKSRRKGYEYTGTMVSDGMRRLSHNHGRTPQNMNNQMIKTYKVCPKQDCGLFWNRNINVGNSESFPLAANCIKI